MKNIKLKIFASFFIIGAILLVYSQNAENRFAPAADFPRDALVYVQFSDLPVAVRLWNESNLKREYLASENFKQFGNRHLAMKIAERFSEFSASGFPFGADLFANASESKAAFAVYDIGKMEAVFIAPVSDAVFSASLMFQKRGDFEEVALEDGIVYYRREIEIDRKRQRQKFAFANVRGRLVAASDEKLLLRTIAVITGKSSKNSLADEPDFAKTAERTMPHTVSVWVNQLRLNNDYYFKHYWLMTPPGDLKKFRAGMFDFEMRDEKWIERRELLLTEKTRQPPKIKAVQEENLLSLLPENIPFAKIETVENQPPHIGKLLQKTLFEREKKERKKSQNFYNWRNYDETYQYFSEEDYSGSDFGKNVDDVEEDESFAVPKTDESIETNLSEAIAAAEPTAAVSAVVPHILSAPMFAEFRRGLILHLRSPNRLERQKLENALAEKLKKDAIIGGKDVLLDWETRTENQKSRRELNLPMLGREIVYALQNDKLFLANSSEFLAELMENEKQSSVVNVENETDFSALTVINLNSRADSFDRIIQRITTEKTISEDFFTGNIASLLDVAAQVQKIEIKQNQSDEFLSEEISFVLK